jgi:KDO2-lipid IV(A) lauroyltransferase
MKKTIYILEALLLSIFMAFLSLFPPTVASNIGAHAGRFIGLKLAASRKAYKHIARALPDLDEAQRKKIITDMWENLGRVVAEYPHLETLARHHTEIVNADILKPLLQRNTGLIFIGAHLGNWEINTAASLLQKNIAVDISYRALNNPWSDKILMRLRSLNGKIKAHSKSRTGGRSMMDVVKNGGALGILIDQKYREGINLPFFGLPAMTNPFFVQLAQKYNAPVIPIRCERLDGVHFRLTVYEPIPTQGRAVEDVLRETNALLEGWIRERPEQWLWLHRRWKDDG